MKFHFVAIAAIALAACTPQAETDGASAPPAPPQPDLAAAAPATGPAAPNTTDTLSSTPVPDAAAPAATPAPAPPAQATAPPAPPATSAQLASGRTAYARVCAMCHGPTGQGVPNLGAALTVKDPAAIRDTVSKGVVKDGATMPPMAGMLQGDELDDVARFVAAGLPQ